MINIDLSISQKLHAAKDGYGKYYGRISDSVSTSDAISSIRLFQTTSMPNDYTPRVDSTNDRTAKFTAQATKSTGKQILGPGTRKLINIKVILQCDGAMSSH
jgi:hypothetical protein